MARLTLPAKIMPGQPADRMALAVNADLAHLERWAGSLPDLVVTVPWPGVLSVTDIPYRLHMPYPCSAASCSITAGTAPVGADLIVDVKKDGSTIYTTAANRPTIPDGEHRSSWALPDVGILSEGSYLTFHIVQVGSGTAGSDLLIAVRFAPPTLVGRGTS